MTPSTHTYIRTLANLTLRYSRPIDAGFVRSIARRRAKNKMAQQSRRRNRRQK